MDHPPQPPLDDHSSDNSGQLFAFLIQGLGITVIALFGVIGNVLCLLVLTRPKLKSSITWFLIGLSFFDLLFLILNILIYSLVSIFTYFDVWEGYVGLMDPLESPFLVVINDTAQTASIYFTLAIALQRYIVIKWPIKSRSFCTYETCGYLSIVVLGFACVYQLIRYLFPAQAVVHDVHALGGCSFLIPTNNASTEPGPDADYEDYFFQWPYMTFIMIAPSVLLIYLNASIWSSMRERQVKRTNLKKGEEKERSITLMLIAVVLVFLLCQTVFYIMFILQKSNTCAWKVSNVYLIPMDLLLITVNSSANFLIYCSFGSMFRTEFCRIFLSSERFGVLGKMGLVVQSTAMTSTSTSPAQGNASNGNDSV